MAKPAFWYGKCEDLRVKAESVGETANPFKALTDIYHGSQLTFECYRKGLELKQKAEGLETSPSLFWELYTDTVYHARLYWYEIAFVLAAAVVWTLARYFLVNYVFLPFAKGVGVLPRNIEKFGESAWKFVAYGITWSTASYVTFYRGYDYFYNTINMWAQTPEERITPPLDLRLVYASETSFYLHCVYATLYMDAWRKDSIVMMIHHFVTLSLIIGSYSVGVMKIGILIFVLDDVSDVVLELGKVATYMRHRTSGYSPFFGILCDVSSLAFAVQWAWLRLQYHLTKVWRAATIGVWVSMPFLPFPCHVFFIVFLGSLYLFYSYWFAYIVMFVIRVLSGKQGTAEDPREEADHKSKTAKDHQNGHQVSNKAKKSE